MKEYVWPQLNYGEWLPTYQTVHLWTQIVGKLRLCKTDWMNHAWNSVLYVTPVGLTTTPFRTGNETLSVDFDFLAHKLIFLTSSGQRLELPLQQECVADFFGRFTEALKYLNVDWNFDPHPNELTESIAFSQDKIHRTYNQADMAKFWRVMSRVDQIFKTFRSEFLGKASPVHFFWGSFDLAASRFSGKVAPMHPGGVPHLPDRVAREAYSHEVSSCGFWPGNSTYPNAAFYAYAYPEPKLFKDFTIQPEAAFYHEGLREFILPYDAAIASQDPEKEIIKFLRSTYRAAAELGKWDRASLEKSELLWEMKRTFNPSHDTFPELQ
jgi:hypothetical protein